MGYLKFTIHTDEKLRYGKDYDFKSIAKEILKIKGVKSVDDYKDEPITDKEWNDSCRGLGTHF
jgi:hypothetical protein